MRLPVVLVVVCGSLLAGAAHAEPTFDLFQKLCVAPAGDRAASLAAADALGWTPMAKEMLDALTKSQKSSQKGADVEARISTANGLHALVVARVNEIIPGQAVPADACGVAAAGVDTQALMAAVTAYAAVPSDPALTDVAAETAFAWRNEGGKHIQMTAADLGKANGRRDVVALDVGGTGGLALVGLTIPTK